MSFRTLCWSVVALLASWLTCLSSPFRMVSLWSTARLVLATAVSPAHKRALTVALADRLSHQDHTPNSVVSGDQGDPQSTSTQDCPTNRGLSAGGVSSVASTSLQLEGLPKGHVYLRSLVTYHRRTEIHLLIFVESDCIWGVCRAQVLFS